MKKIFLHIYYVECFVLLFISGLLASGVIPLPKEISFPLEKHETWCIKYDYIQFPSIDDKSIQLNDAIPGKASCLENSKKGAYNSFN